MPGLRVLEELEGTWNLTRRIAHANGDQHQFEGVASFSNGAGGLILDETGKLTGAPGQLPLTATRRYFYRADAGEVAVFFDNDRPFHRIPLGVDAPEATHDCPPDTYHVAYDFTDLTAWTARWKVTGPRKDYVMTSTYARSCPAAEPVR